MKGQSCLERRVRIRRKDAWLLMSRCPPRIRLPGSGKDER